QRCIELLNDRIGMGKEIAGEIEREGCVGVEVVPFDQIADRANEDRFEATSRVGVAVERCAKGLAWLRLIWFDARRSRLSFRWGGPQTSWRRNPRGPQLSLWAACSRPQCFLREAALRWQRASRHCLGSRAGVFWCSIWFSVG